MKKTILLIIVFVLCTVVAGGIFYQIGYEDGQKYKEYKLANDVPIDERIGQLDYPLIDIAFNDGNEYAVVICSGIYSEEQTYLWCRDGDDLRFNTEDLYVRTYPAGRGTTGNGVITVYRNEERIRDVEFLEMHFVNEEIENKFVKVSAKELNDYLETK